MASVLLHPKFDFWAQNTLLSDGAYRLLVTGLGWSVANGTDWCVPQAKANLTPTFHRNYVHELVRAGWWVIEGENFAFRSPRPGMTLWRRDPADRTAIDPKVRAFVYERDGHKCLICEAADDLTLDHIWPWSRGGSDEPGNLRTLCRPCNSRKGAKV